MTRPTRNTAGGPVVAVALAFVLGGLVLYAPGAAASAQVVHAAEYGVAPDSTVDNTPALQRALDVAVYRRQPGQWAVVQLPAGVIGYRGVLRINADSLEIRGVGGAVLTRDTTADGAAYYPVRRLDRVRPGAPVTVLRVLSGAFEPGRRLQPTRWIVWSRGRTARRWHRLRLSHLIMDGNVAGNLAGLRAIGRGGSGPSKKSFLQDGAGHTALAANGHDRTELCADGPRTIRLPRGGTARRTGSQVGTLIAVDHVVVEGYTATGLVGNRCTRWRGSVVRGSNAFYNHVFYHADGGVRWQDQEQMGDMGPLSAWGGWDHVTLAGGAWTYWISQSGLRVQNLVFEDPEPNPLRSNADLFDVRWGTAFVDGFTAAAPIPRRFWKSNGGHLVLDAGAGTPPPDSLLVLPVAPRRTGSP